MQPWCYVPRLTSQRLSCGWQRSLSTASKGIAITIASQPPSPHLSNPVSLISLFPKVAVRHFSTQLEQSLSRLTIKDLSSLLNAMGLQLSGTKPVLKNRLLTHMGAILHKVERLEPEFSRHGTIFEASSNPCTLPSCQEQRLERKVDGETLERIQQRVLPRSIVSIDVGIRNLAWVELSRDGEILRWSVEDLLGPIDENHHDHRDETEDCDGSLKVSAQGEQASGDNAPPIKTIKATRGKGAKVKVKAPALPFDSRSVALRLDKVMHKIVDSEALEGVIVEQQRFRTAGMHSVLDATFRCGVLEGMIHVWLAVWQQALKKRQQQQEKIAEMTAGAAGKEQDQTKDVKENEDVVFVESVSPRAVASWWGIGAAAKTQTITKSNSDALDASNTSEVNDAGGRASKTRGYHTKKGQSRNMVDQWIRNSDNDLITPMGEGDRIGARFRLRCRTEVRDWYGQEKKRDDLSDCLLQAISWYEWRGRAIEEAVERSRGGQKGI
ncbi:mitochondrial resolvase Ydc2 [Gamsiella multidivaricata]|uniref:mitochondrial resolvase Ydc2 n=1 Tax=Gamsiella multidivaricata TaxID=101098 RepID=UPI002220DBCC|nr:mitochondrial resolvase Ydc2 [Gamsiella multidivaricata]KAI7822184.1 mitochondrial resolvase Ydc2 [Gamsiella multidivaricata]